MAATILVGNGLGKAIDSNHFDLRTGLEVSWNSFDEAAQRIISLGQGQPLTSEDDLESHQELMTACRNLVSFGDENTNINWLSDEGVQFPDIYQNFIYRTAKHYFDYASGEAINEFIDNFDSLRNKLSQDNDVVHIATLNYDKLLYGALIDREILAGYRNFGLVDGFHVWDSGFSSDNLRRTHCNFGWYLHLHGSPVFYTENNQVNKVMLTEGIPDNPVNNGRVHDHIVLAQTEKKPEIIANSILLQTYGDFFNRALNQSDQLHIVGYGGGDKHVNAAIQQWVLDKKRARDSIHIFVAVRIGSQKSEEDWRRILVPNNVTQDDSFLNFKIVECESVIKYDFGINQDE